MTKYVLIVSNILYYITAVFKIGISYISGDTISVFRLLKKGNGHSLLNFRTTSILGILG